MKRVFLILFILLFTQALLAADSRQVRLRILDDGRPQAGVAVQVNYPDGERTSGTTVELTSDSAGFVTFTTPADVFWVSVPSLNSEVSGRRFDIPKNAARQLRWDIRPRDWKPEGPR
jgi:uncharacterized GH25 family protein